jgi:hypothetical protein
MSIAKDIMFEEMAVGDLGEEIREWMEDGHRLVSVSRAAKRFKSTPKGIVAAVEHAGLTLCDAAGMVWIEKELPENLGPLLIEWRDPWWWN